MASFIKLEHIDEFSIKAFSKYVYSAKPMSIDAFSTEDLLY
jgi:hypothetical protein